MSTKVIWIILLVVTLLLSFNAYKVQTQDKRIERQKYMQEMQQTLKELKQINAELYK